MKDKSNLLVTKSGVGLPAGWWPLFAQICKNTGRSRNGIFVEAIQKWMDEHPAEVEAARAMLAEQAEK